MAELVEFLIKELTNDGADNLSKAVELTQLAWTELPITVFNKSSVPLLNHKEF